MHRMKGSGLAVSLAPGFSSRAHLPPSGGGGGGRRPSLRSGLLAGLVLSALLAGCSGYHRAVLPSSGEYAMEDTARDGSRVRQPWDLPGKPLLEIGQAARVTMRDGASHCGVMVSITPHDVTLQAAGERGERIVLPRSGIATVAAASPRVTVGGVAKSAAALVAFGLAVWASAWASFGGF
jgi:hypothetical protein